MKKILLLFFCMLAGAWALSAQQTIYIIDNETVEFFDGSQLKGRTVRDYKITQKGSGRHAITIHAITTSPSVYSVSGSFSPLKPMARLDSLRTLDHSRFTTFSADSVFVSDEAFKVLSKKIIYIIDGKESENPSPLNIISPTDIESISVVKDGSSEQLKYGDDVTVIKITTKKNKADMTKFLKTLPGVEVDSEGRITINGQAVKKITINGQTYSVETK